MKLTNQQMDVMCHDLEPLLERRDVVGYAAARNVRLLREQLTEYLKVRDELVEKYGEAEVVDGEQTGRMMLSPKSPRFREFCDELMRFARIEHDFEPFRIGYGEAIGKLSGQELLAADWMFEES